MYAKCSRNFVATSSYTWWWSASSSAISSRFKAYIAIHAVPSLWSRHPPTGSAAERSNGPTLSSPRKPPSKRLLPVESLRLTHQVEHPKRGPGVDRWVHVAERPLVGGDLAVGMHVPLAQQQQQL